RPSTGARATGKGPTQPLDHPPETAAVASGWRIQEAAKGAGSEIVFQQPDKGYGYLKTFRLAVYLPSEKQWFLTEPVQAVPTDEHQNFSVTLSEDGTGTLTRLAPSPPSPGCGEGCGGCLRGVALPAGGALFVTIMLVVGGLWLASRLRTRPSRR